MSYINPGDSILVDKGFYYPRATASKASKNIYTTISWTKGEIYKRRGTPDENNMAKVRIQVERFNERLLDDTIPLILSPIASPLVYVARYLVNFQDCLCK